MVVMTEVRRGADLAASLVALTVDWKARGRAYKTVTSMEFYWVERKVGMWGS